MMAAICKDPQVAGLLAELGLGNEDIYIFPAHGNNQLCMGCRIENYRL